VFCLRTLAISLMATTCLGAALMASGCGGLTPFAEVRRSLPDDEFVQIDGRWVHVERSGAGPALVLIHGFGGSTFTFRNVVPSLSDAFDVIAVDLNGFGFTERPRSASEYSIDAQAQLVLSVLDELGVSSAHLLGHSYGVGVVLHLADVQPDRVETLILVSGGAPGGGPASRMIPRLLQPIVHWYVESFLLTAPRIRRALERSVFDRSVVDSNMVNGYLARLRVEGLRDALSGLQSREAWPERRVEVASIERKTLIIWGEQDGIIPIRVGERLAEELPDATLIRFEATGHLPMEEQPERFVETINEFLSP
jgi:pimeloyl-ACP methyl ester carboxylesterase